MHDLWREIFSYMDGYELYSYFTISKSICSILSDDKFWKFKFKCDFQEEKRTENSWRNEYKDVYEMYHPFMIGRRKYHQLKKAFEHAFKYDHKLLQYLSKRYEISYLVKKKKNEHQRYLHLPQIFEWYDDRLRIDISFPSPTFPFTVRDLISSIRGHHPLDECIYYFKEILKSNNVKLIKEAVDIILLYLDKPNHDLRERLFALILTFALENDQVDLCHYLSLIYPKILVYVHNHLSNAIQHNSLHVIKYLISRGIKIRNYKDIVKQGNLETYKLCNPSKKNIRRMSIVAAKYGHYHIVRYCDSITKVKYHKIAVYGARSGNLDIVRWAVEKGELERTIYLARVLWIALDNDYDAMSSYALSTWPALRADL